MKYRFTLLLIAACALGCVHSPKKLPPAPQLMGPGPGVAGPGPGVIPPMMPVPPLPAASSQVAFVGPEGLQVQWQIGGTGYDSEPLIAPARYNFPQNAIYRLKITNIPNRPGLELYPTLEVGPALPRTEAFLAHSAIPIQFTPEDFDQVVTGNFVTKVIYLPDPENQELAIAGVETLVSTRLDPGVDPIVEADKRGAILAIVRLGNKDEEAANALGGEVVGGAFMAGGPAGVPSSYPPGPQWGMPRTGTPIGLQGPPHIPLGVPAGMQKHTIHNHTRYHLPQPTEHLHIDVKEQPGYRYPKPVDHIRILEKDAAGAQGGGYGYPHH